jgi:uncharacterized protein (TIGR03435 family)
MIGIIAAQNAPERLAFEVVSVKPAEGLVAGKTGSLGMRVDGAQVHLNRYALKSLITMAYKLRRYQVVGPDWLDSMRFDIDAKLPAGTTPAQIPDMLQALLADRFQMTTHDGTKEVQVYALLVASAGTKLTDLSDPADTPDVQDPSISTGYGGPRGMGNNYGNGSSYTLGDNKFEGKKLSMARLALVLTSWLDRPVVDMTGLRGKYDIGFPVSDEDLRGWVTRAFLQGGGSASPEMLQSLDSVDDASLHAGLRAVGLKLDSRKAAVPVLIVDSILRSPTEN